MLDALSHLQDFGLKAEMYWELAASGNPKA
jgi:hypothetical protein